MKLFAVERERLPDDRWITTETALPQAVAQNDDAAARFVFIWQKDAAKQRLNPKQWEQISRYQSTLDMRCLFSVGQGETSVSVNGDALEYSILRPPIEGIWIGTGRFVVHVVRAEAHVVRCKRHNLFGFFERQRTQKDGIEDTEDGGIRANT